MRSQQHQLKSVGNLVDAVLDSHACHAMSLAAEVQFGEAVPLSHEGAGNSSRSHLRASRPKSYRVGPRPTTTRMCSPCSVTAALPPDRPQPGPIKEHGDENHQTRINRGGGLMVPAHKPE